ncbi:2-hydroxychromene-2-carboxylate isomerase [Celeribacter neptunius]|uniref:2-hydroxychromene-2-carboxylate isomerase n=1 Tax=Celeribacter neptunius TaxID=588602 RepID=A0A1I3W2T7_9RHOB|nr:2-hydroxychromene-2-carboxylate isomerase [Celeribacter neptunius]SFK01740.1 2-hydroxychromene-2-carboxylate isomerase [Celeribacter neptunius]
MAHIDYYFSLLSSFTYLAGDRFAEIAEKHGATVRYKPFDILTMFDRLGAPRPADRPEGRKIYRMQELKRFAAQAGKPMKFQPAFWPTNAAPGSYAVIAAQEALENGAEGDLDGLVQRLLKAVWEEDRDIADDAVITEALKASGFDPMLSMTGMLKGAETYAKNLEDAVSVGVFGSPFYIITDTDERFWGQDRLDMLDAYLGSL